MSYELDAMCAQLNRLERQLRILKISGCRPRRAGGDHGARASSSRAAGQRYMRVKQLIVEDAQGRARVGSAREPPD